MPGIDLVVTLNCAPNQEQKKKVQEWQEHDHQIEVTSPNRVTFVIPDNQLQTEQERQDDNKGFATIKKGRGINKNKGKKSKEKNQTPSDGRRKN